MSEVPKIGGWLILIGIRMGIILLVVVSVMPDAAAVAAPLALALGYVFWRFVTRSRQFVSSYIVVNGAILALSWAAESLAGLDHTTTFGAAIGEMIVIAYLLKSERVEETFVL